MPSKWICVSYGLKSKLKNYVVSDRSCFFIAVDVDPMLTIVLAKLILERSSWPGPVICWNCVALLNSFMYSNWSYVFLLSVNSKSYWSLSFSMFVGLFVSFCLLCVVRFWSVLVILLVFHVISRQLGAHFLSSYWLLIAFRGQDGQHGGW